MSDIAIKVENLHKLYRLGLKEEVNDSFVASCLSWLKAPKRNLERLKKLSRFDLNSTDEDVLHALKDVSFEVKHGEVVGIIGRNGAGKSTLLKVLSRITEPTLGRVVINGRVASLLEVGTGFHPELSGRENIYMNGTILGMTKKEIDRKFDEIVEFSGVEKFLDTPIKRYSSGMKVRLAFSVAAHLEPEILIIDEVLAVGDAAFQKKCLGKMHDVAKEGRTVLFVSHQMEAVSNLCSRAIMLEDGMVSSSGGVEEVISLYLSKMSFKSTISLCDRLDRQGNGRVRFTESWVEDAEGNKVGAIRLGAPMKIIIKYKATHDQHLTDLKASISINSIKNIPVTFLSNSLTGELVNVEMPRCGSLECFIPRLPINVGSYSYNLSMHMKGILEDWVPEACSFDVESGDFYGTGKIEDFSRVVLIDHSWDVSAG